MRFSQGIQGFLFPTSLWGVLGFDSVSRSSAAAASSSAASSLFHTHNLLTHSLSHTTCSHTHNFVTHNFASSLFHTQLVHTHTQLCHTTCSHTHSHATCHSHTTCSHTHTQLCQTPPFCHIQWYHTTLSHTHTHNLLINLRFARHAWHLLTPTFVLHGRHGTYDTGLDLVARLGPVSRPWCCTLCAAGVALGEINRQVAWQVWHLVKSTFVLRGRPGTCSHQPSFCVAGMALMTLGWIWWRAWGPLVARGAAHFAWQAWHLATSTVRLRGKCDKSTFVLRGRHGTYDAGLDLVVRLGLVSRPWRCGTLRGRRGTWRHQPSGCVASAALGQIDLRFAWHAWHLWCWVGSGGALGGPVSHPWHRGTLRGRRGAWRHHPSGCVASAALGHIDLRFAS